MKPDPRTLLIVLSLTLLLQVPGASPGLAEEAAQPAPVQTEPLAIGQTFTLESKVLGETRRINVYLPAFYDEADAAELRFPVLYMPDGGIGEDFLHVAGLVQIGTLNWTMKPMILVGIENTERRRDLTGPTEVDEDQEIAPRVGGSAAFRKFLRDELLPTIEATYRTTDERALVGESLAGLFVVETFLLEPDLFDTYLAFDPSLWWNDQHLVKSTEALLEAKPHTGKTLYLATSSQEEIAEITKRFAERLEALSTTEAGAGFTLHHVPMPDETHLTIYHPAALAGFRAVLGRPAEPDPEVADP